MHIRADVADEFLHIGYVIVEMKGAGIERHHARVGPVGDVDLVVLQQALDRVAQQRGMVARKRRHNQHGGLRLHQFERTHVVGEALEAQQAAKRLGDGNLFLHRDVDTTDLGRSDAELRLLVVLGQAMHQPEPCGHALCQRRVRERRQRVVVQLGRRGGELGKRRHQRALRFVKLVQHSGLL